MEPIKNAPGYVKDRETGVVINNNISEYQIILERRKHQKEITSLREEMDDLKQMVRKVMGNK